MRGHVADRELLLSLDGELPPRRQSRVARHVDSCTACRDRAAGLRLAMQDVVAGYRAVHRHVPRGSHAAGRARLEQALNVAVAARPSWLDGVAAVVGPAPLRVLGIAACVILVCAVALVAARVTSRPVTGVVAAGALPESVLTPGAVSPLTAAELCHGVRPSRLVTEAVRQQVLRAYGMEHVSTAAYELDALITPELGGSTDAANLWPQRYQSPVWNARVKDELERLLPEMVCSGRITLAEAQREIASDWVAAYKRHFRTDVPLLAHTGPAADEDDELVFVSGGPVATQAAFVAASGR